MHITQVFLAVMSLEVVAHVGPTADVDIAFSVGTDGHVVMHGNVVSLITL